MGLVMTKDGQVRPLRLEDLKEVAERDERIRQLEQLNATLAAQVDRMRPVVDAAQKWSNTYDDGAEDTPLLEAVTEYYGQMAQLAKPSE